MNREILSTQEKALQINLDPSKYGTFVEIGAGQEVARWFFHVGGAAGTIAKTLSAYDMSVSDAIYGRCERYVSHQRLEAMLQSEYALLLQRLDEKQGNKTNFFVFADTVAARSYLRRDEAHGWLGIRFQTSPRSEFSQIDIHVRLLDEENVREQEALGILGVNLIYAAIFRHEDPSEIIENLMENLSRDRIEVDVVRFSGPAYGSIDNRLMALKLVEKGLTDAAMFTPDGEIMQAADGLYRKPILVERGSFRPVTKTTLDMLECAEARFSKEPEVAGKTIVKLMEMTLKNLVEGGEVNHQDFLDRVDILGTLNKTVLISNYGEFHRLAAYLFRCTKEKVGVVLGIPSLRNVFDEKYYTDLEGGILESFGRLFKNNLKMYVYPLLKSENNELITVETLMVEPHLKHLYAYLVDNRYLEGLVRNDFSYSSIFPKDVLAKIRCGDSGWEQMVPPEVIQIIKERKLFNHPGL